MKRIKKRGRDRLRRLGRWLLAFRPVFASTMQRQVEQERSLRLQNARHVTAKHERELAQTEAIVKTIVQRCSTVEFRREDRSDRYAVTVQFEPRMMMSGPCGRDELAMIAKYVAHNVEAEIATSRFVQSANDYERAAERWRR